MGGIKANFFRGGGAIITPDELPNLAMWYDGTDPSSMTLDGSNGISAMTDKSPNGVVITNGGNTPLPLYDGSKIVFSTGGAGLGGAFNPNILSNIHGFMVFTGWDDGLMYAGNRNGSTNRLSFGKLSGDILSFTHYATTWNNAKILALAPMSNSSYILEFKKQGSVLSGFLDGADLAPDVTGGTPTPTADYFNLGGRNQYTANEWGFYEWIISDVELTTEQRAGILNYLANKY